MIKRETMTKSEKNIFEANLKLVNEKNEMFKDIITLINYINGNEELKESVYEIIEYYSHIQIKGKDYKRK